MHHMILENFESNHNKVVKIRSNILFDMTIE